MSHNGLLKLSRISITLAGQIRLPLLHRADPDLRIGLAHPILVRELLFLAVVIHADEILRRHFDPALMRHTLRRLAKRLALGGRE
jgi:hypothetical protein